MDATVDRLGNTGPAVDVAVSEPGLSAVRHSGLAPGNVQANLVVLPVQLAHDFSAVRAGKSAALPSTGGIGGGVASAVSRSWRRS